MLPEHPCLADSFESRAFCGTYSRNGSIFISGVQGKKILEFADSRVCYIFFFFVQITVCICMILVAGTSSGTSQSVLVMLGGAYWTLQSGEYHVDSKMRGGTFFLSLSLLPPL